MSIQSKYITSLELDKVLAKLANETTCEAARRRALRLTPVTTEEEAVREPSCPFRNCSRSCTCWKPSAG